MVGKEEIAIETDIDSGGKAEAVGLIRGRRRHSQPLAANDAAADRGRRNAGKAGDGIRTHDNHVGNVVLYQLSYTRS